MLWRCDVTMVNQSTAASVVFTACRITQAMQVNKKIKINIGHV